LPMLDRQGCFDVSVYRSAQPLTEHPYIVTDALLVLDGLRKNVPRSDHLRGCDKWAQVA
jgi:hypothetical protein